MNLESSPLPGIPVAGYIRLKLLVLVETYKPLSTWTVQVLSFYFPDGPVFAFGRVWILSVQQHPLQREQRRTGVSHMPHLGNQVSFDGPKLWRLQWR